MKRADNLRSLTRASLSYAAHPCGRGEASSWAIAFVSKGFSGIHFHRASPSIPHTLFLAEIQNLLYLLPIIFAG
jgi:hypothetical protein